MPRIKYKEYRPSTETANLIETCNQILFEYEAQGYSLTLRQLYYQLVSRDVIPNTVKSYTKLGNVVSRARDGGLIDWDHIEDRARNVRAYQHWKSGEDFLHDVAGQFSLDWWDGQPTRCFVFVEKEALEQVIGRAASAYDVPYLANKGYLSSSIAWEVAHKRMLMAAHGCKRFVVIHLGDHDPSGIDMTRDIRERLRNYARPTSKEHGFIKIGVARIALNMDQIEHYSPPPNPAKDTDTRFKSYQDLYGDESWELDALDPGVIDQLIRTSIEELIKKPKLFQQQKDREHEIRSKLQELTLSNGEGE